MSELGHLPAGISHWRLGRFDLYRVNPPLVRMVAALPALLTGANVDWAHYSTEPLIRSESTVGIDFAYANGKRTLWLFTLGRWVCIPFSLIGQIVCYRWSRDLYGPIAGLVAMTLWCFCPNILGHGALLTPDVPAAALAVASYYAFWQWVKRPTWSRAIAAGVTLGLAELTKTTLIIFYVLWPLYWISYRLTDARKTPNFGFTREACMLAVCMLTSVYVVNLGYGFEGTFQYLGEYRFSSQMMTGARMDGLRSGNRYAHTCLGALPIPLPRNYLQGIDAQKEDFERGKRSYLRGVWRDRGWWYFYLYALAIKVPIGTWILIALPLVPLLRGQPTRQTRDALVVLIPLLAILVFVSCQSGFSIHARYIFPVLPFAFIWASKAAQDTRWDTPATYVPWILALTVAVTSSLCYYPHSISYFNESVGGPRKGHEHLLDSSIAWGQDLAAIKKWYDEHPEARPFHLATFGYMDPRILGIDFRLPPGIPLDCPAGVAKLTGSGAPRPGWYVIDVNFLHDSRAAAPNGAGGFACPNDDCLSLRYFRFIEPVDSIGYSTYVYHIGASDTKPAQ